MKRLIRFLKGYEKESFLAPLFKMLEATFELIVPLVVANIMDIGIKNQDNAYIWHQCVIMVLLGVIGLVCALTAQYFSAKAAMGFSTALRKVMYAHIRIYHQLILCIKLFKTWQTQLMCCLFQDIR